MLETIVCCLQTALTFVWLKATSSPITLTSLRYQAFATKWPCASRSATFAGGRGHIYPAFGTTICFSKMDQCIFWRRGRGVRRMMATKVVLRCMQDALESLRQTQWSPVVSIYFAKYIVTEIVKKSQFSMSGSFFQFCSNAKVPHTKLVGNKMY